MDQALGSAIKLTQRECAIAELLIRLVPRPVDQLVVCGVAWGTDFDGAPSVAEICVG